MTDLTLLSMAITGPRDVCSAVYLDSDRRLLISNNFGNFDDADNFAQPYINKLNET